MEVLGNGRGKRLAKKLTIEDYLDFFDDRTLLLTANQLRQVIGMHGFKRIGAQKNILTEMVSTMEVMDLRRSTLLDDGISGDATLTLKEVINDLKFLEWRECHVISLLTHSGSLPSTTSHSTVSVTVGDGESENWKGGEEGGKIGLDAMGETEDDCIEPERLKRQKWESPEAGV